MPGEAFEAEGQPSHTEESGVSRRWWRRRDVDLMVRMSGAVITASGVVILHVFCLNIGRYSSGLLAFMLGFAGAGIIGLGAALVLLGTRYFGAGKGDLKEHGAVPQLPAS